MVIKELYEHVKSLMRANTRLSDDASHESEYIRRLREMAAIKI